MPENTLRYFVHYRTSPLNEGYCIVHCHEGKFLWPRENKSDIIRTIEIHETDTRSLNELIIAYKEDYGA